MDAILDSYRTNEAARILQSVDPSKTPLDSPPLGVLLIIIVVSFVLLASGFIIIAVILDPSTSMIDQDLQEEE
ncbi:hypothetical protein PFISCL1PPCAC_6360, partial [Pristionchus fissidentatus]